ncbi:MAG: SurA N-terminal domain-containing protein [Burkholderiales bacterium]|nr:SurA N-terminal domain-containing protein [Burkholderiales bacterium]
MFADTIHEKMKGPAARIVLVILIIAFAWTGIDTYNKADGLAQKVAKVGEREIALPVFEEALKKEQSRLREAGEKNPAVLNSAELRMAVLERMVREQLLIQQAAKLGYSANEASILAAIRNEPMFQENGKFSETLLQRILENNRLNLKKYMASIAQDTLSRELVAFQADTGIAPRVMSERLAQVMAEQREVSKAVLRIEEFAPQVKLDAQQIQNFYEKHPELSRVPEQARVEYIVFTPEAVLAQLQVTEADAKAYYDKHADQFALPERREVAHLLIRVTPDAKPEDKQAAREKAQQLLTQLQQNPKQFAELAKQHSQDPLTAAKGGALGAIQRGTIFPQVEQAVFGMAAGEVKGLVESPAGLHILQVKAITGGGQRSFAEVQDTVMEAAKRDMALRKFNEEVEQFGDMVYAKSDSLKPAADKYQLTVQTSDWFERQGPAQGLLKNERLMNAIFSSDAIQGKRNTEAMEVAPNTLVAARIVAYKAAGNKPMEAVKAEIEARLRKDEAAVLATKQGESLLAELKQGRTVSTLKFGAAKKIGRDQAQREGFGLDEIQTIFRAGAKTLPSYTGKVLSDGSFAVYKISSITSDENVKRQVAQIAPLSLRQILAEQTTSAYLDSLRTQGKVSIKQAVLDKVGERN